MSTERTLGPWQLGEVHPVDCLSALQEIPSDSVDVVVTSPPYWGQRGYGTIGTEADPREYLASLLAVLHEALRSLKPSGTLWLNLGDAYNTPINWRPRHYVHSTLGRDQNGFAADNSAYTKDRGCRRACIDDEVQWLQYGNLLALPHRVIVGLCDRGWLFRGEVIWQKSRPLPEGRCRRPHRRHEGIYIFAKSEKHLFQVKPPIGSVWRLTQTPNRTTHCSTFPVDLPLECIRASAVAPPGIVVDPFMGSGTTAVAAGSLGHDFLGFEVDPELCGMANERIAKELAQSSLGLP